MSKDKYDDAFLEGLAIEDVVKLEDLEFNDIEEWDSIGHMSLMSAIEETFEISLETDDIVDFSSYKKGLEILKKYNVDISL